MQDRIRRFRSVASLLIVLIALAQGCSSEDETGPNNGMGWDLGDNNVQDQGPVDMPGGGDQSTPVDMSARDEGVPDQDPVEDQGQVEDMPTGQDMQSTEDMSVSMDMAQRDMAQRDMAARPDMNTVGQDCQLNRECGAGEVCCPQLNPSSGQCQLEADCMFTSGYCSTNADCPASASSCCEAGAQIGNNRKVCLDACPGSGSMTTCANNTDCSIAGEVCCPGFGQNTCQPDSTCFGNSGLCENAMQCGGTQDCCDFQQVKVCQDSCPGSNGGSACTNNDDCTTAGDVCCPQLNGQPVCTPRSDCLGGQGGGICADVSQCAMGEMCCNYFATKVCQAQCFF